MIWGLMVPPLPQKWLVFTNLGQGLSQKVGFSVSFEPILYAEFFDKMLSPSNKKSMFCPCFWLFWLLYFHIFLLKDHLKGSFFIEKHLKIP